MVPRVRWLYTTCLGEDFLWKGLCNLVDIGLDANLLQASHLGLSELSDVAIEGVLDGDCQLWFSKTWSPVWAREQHEGAWWFNRQNTGGKGKTRGRRNASTYEDNCDFGCHCVGDERCGFRVTKGYDTRWI